MSHRASNWAIQQRGLAPATKLVPWHLCDRHNPDYKQHTAVDDLAGVVVDLEIVTGEEHDTGRFSAWT